MYFILCETPSSESHFFPITVSGKEKKAPWHQVTYSKPQRTQTVCLAARSPFHSLSGSCMVLNAPRNVSSSKRAGPGVGVGGGAADTVKQSDEKAWPLAPRCPARGDTAQISPSCSGQPLWCLLHQVQGPAKRRHSTDLPLLLRAATLMSPTPGTGSCHQLHTLQRISHSGLWLLLCCPFSLTHHMLLEGEDNFCFVHHWLPSAWHLVGT